MARLQIKVSDSAIKRAVSDPKIKEIKALGEPFLLRVHASRSSASWYLVSYKRSKTVRTKLGNWPALSAKQVLLQKQELMGSLALNNPQTLNDWESVGELLAWYRDRALSDKSLSDKRKLNIKSSMNKHLICELGAELITDLTEQTLDEFVWRMQSRYALGTVKQHFALLKRAFKQAKKLNRINEDPLQALSFTDFIDAKIMAKSSKLQSKDLSELLLQIKGAKPFHQTFIIFMLAHGTRIGETRQLRWDHIDFDAERLIIPAKITKTKTELVVPLTTWAFAWLEQHKLYQSMWGYSGVYLFPSSTKRGCISESIANDWVRTVSRGNWTAHDLRKLARSCWADIGIDYMIAERLLNHALSKLDQAYIHTHVENQKRNALTLWHKKLEQIKKNKQTDTEPTQTDF